MSLGSWEGLDGARVGWLSEASSKGIEWSSAERRFSKVALEPSPSSCSERGAYWEELGFALEDMARGGSRVEWRKEGAPWVKTFLIAHLHNTNHLLTSLARAVGTPLVNVRLILEAETARKVGLHGVVLLTALATDKRGFRGHFGPAWWILANPSQCNIHDTQSIYAIRKNTQFGVAHDFFFFSKNYYAFVNTSLILPSLSAPFCT